MADRPKSPKPHSDHTAGTYSKNSEGTPTHAGDAAAVKYENRFAEVTRKSREARERLNAASQVRAERREVVDRDRDYVRPADNDPAAEGDHPAPYAGAHSSVRGQRPPTTLERAAALLDGDVTPADENNEESS